MAKQAVENTSAVADILREERLGQGLSLGDIAADICVRRCFLEAIEQGNTSDLPEQTFAVGFVRSYAKMLGLDAAAIAAQFKTELLALDTASPLCENDRADAPAPVTEFKTSIKPQRVHVAHKSWPSWFAPIAGLVGATASWVFISAQMTGAVWQADNAPTPEDIEVQQLAAIQARYIEKDDTNFLAAPAGQNAAPMQAEGFVRGWSYADSGVDQRGSLFFSAANADVQAVPAGADVLTLHANEDSWLQLSYADGTAMWSGVLRAGQDYTPRIINEVFLTTSNAGGVFVVSGQKVVGPLGERGAVVKDLALDQTILSDQNPSLAEQAE